MIEDSGADEPVYNVEDYTAIVKSLRMFAESVAEDPELEPIRKAAFESVWEAETNLLLARHPGLTKQEFGLDRTVDPYWVCWECGKSTGMYHVRKFLHEPCVRRD